MIWVFITLALLVLIYLLQTCNHLNLLHTKLSSEFDMLNTEILKRYDMIPEVLATEASSGRIDEELKEQIVRARNLSMSANQYVQTDPDNLDNFRLLLGAESRLSHFMFQILQTPVNPTEVPSTDGASGVEAAEQNNKVLISSAKDYQKACDRFNSAVFMYNQAVMTFPASMVATLFSFKTKIRFSPEVSPVSMENPWKLGKES